MDFSIVLILPFAAIVAFATLLGAAVAKRARPRLVWPFAFSTFAVALVFLQRPEASMLGYWILAFIMLGLWAAAGTAIGAIAARMILAAANFLRRR